MVFDDFLVLLDIFRGKLGDLHQGVVFLPHALYEMLVELSDALHHACWQTLGTHATSVLLVEVHSDT